MTPTEQTYAYTLYGCDLRQWAPVDPDALSTWSAECEQCGWETSRTLIETAAIKAAELHFRRDCTNEIPPSARRPIDFAEELVDLTPPQRMPYVGNIDVWGTPDLDHVTEITCVANRFGPPHANTETQKP